jgi:hypothetical protein
MLDPLRRIMVEYKPLLVIMQVDQIYTQMAKVNVIKFPLILVYYVILHFDFFS